MQFFCYKCSDCVPHTQIIVKVSFNTQIRQIYEDKLSSRQYQSSLDADHHTLISLPRSNKANRCFNSAHTRQDQHISISSSVENGILMI